MRARERDGERGRKQVIAQPSFFSSLYYPLFPQEQPDSLDENMTHTHTHTHRETHTASHTGAALHEAHT